MQGQSPKTNLVNSSIAHWNWFKVFKLTSQFTLGVILLWWVVNSLNLEGARVAEAFSQASFTLLSLAVLCFALSIILKSLQYFLLLSSPVSNEYMAGVILSQHALLTFVPWRLGEISLPVLLRRDQKIPLVMSVSSLMAIRSADLLVVSIVAMSGIQKLGFEVSFGKIVFGIGVATFFVCAAEFVVRQLRGQSALKALVTAIKPFGNPFRIGCVLLLSTGGFIVSTVQSLFVLQALGLVVSLSDIALLNALTLLAALVPIHPPGGWGTIDSLQILILQYLNYHPEISAPVILAAHCFYTLVVVLGGVVGWIIRSRNILQ